LDVADYSFREMARDPIALMDHLGIDRFHVVGHDRGGRTAHRMALDIPQRIKSITVMDIVPTHLLLADLTADVARAYYHWFFLAQPAPLPETMIGADPVVYYKSCLMGWGAANEDQFDRAQMRAYEAAWRDPDCIRGMCNDYRAALTHDFELDAGDLHRRLRMPACVMWGRDGIMELAFDVPATWADRFSNITAHGMRGGHFFPDEYPEQTAQTLNSFLKSVSD
jgi:haloacetate dehalogenase